MDYGNYLFCDKLSLREIPQEINKAFDGLRSERLYAQFRNWFDKATTDSTKGFPCVDRCSFSVLKTGKTNYEQSKLVGLDLPVTLRKRNAKCRQTVAIIGIDPLRNPDDFKDKKGLLVVGTPYAFHSRYYTSSEARTKTYFSLAVKLADEGNLVYCTDLFKVWMCKDLKTKKKHTITHGDRKACLESLVDELKIVDPHVIVLFGSYLQRATGKRLEEEFNDRIIRVPHPSGSANGAWGEVLNNKKINSENKVEFIFNKVNEKLRTILR